jgi:hypothetical protein
VVDKIDKQEMAANYGFALAFFQGNDELWALFNRAVKQTWTADRFVARLRGTDWFKKHSAAVRNSYMQETSDPQTYKANVDQMFATVRDTYAGMFGTSGMNHKQLYAWAETAHKLGWSEAQLLDRITKGMDYQKLLRSNSLGGTAAALEGQLRALTKAYGVDLGAGWRARQVKRLLSGSPSDQGVGMEGIQNQIRELAMREYKAFADEIAGGKTVQDIAEPYIQKMASLLELNPAEINLGNKMIQKALKQRTADGKPAAMDFGDFEDFVRKDRRWQFTDNAREEMASVTASVAQAFGQLA